MSNLCSYDSALSELGKVISPSGTFQEESIDPDAVSRYLEYLKTGDADYSINVLQKAGVDMSTPLAVEETFKVLEGLVDRLELG